MHILTVISVPYPPVEGMGTYVHNLSLKMIERGHRVTIVTRSSGYKTEREMIHGLEVIRAPFIPLYPVYMYIHGIHVNRLFRSMESQVDIIHVHSPLPPVINTSLPMVVTIHTPMLTDIRYSKITSLHSLFSKTSARFISYPLEKKHIRTSKTVTTVSKSVAQELEEYGLKREQVVVIGNGVDEEIFHPRENQESQDKKYILYAGRIDRDKGLFDLLKCGEYLFKERSDIVFVIAGEGRDLNILRKRANGMKLRDRVMFLGQVDRDQLVQWYQKSSIFTLPSYHEGLPTVLLEAMACGLPVVATDVRGNRDLVSHNDNGILVPPHSPQKLAGVISSLLDDEELRRSLGQNGRRTIEKNYTWDKISKKMLECYESLTGV